MPASRWYRGWLTIAGTDAYARKARIDLLRAVVREYLWLGLWVVLLFVPLWLRGLPVSAERNPSQRDRLGRANEVWSIDFAFDRVARLWKDLVREGKNATRRVDFEWVKGHRKDKHNKAVDKLAKQSTNGFLN